MKWRMTMIISAICGMDVDEFLWRLGEHEVKGGDADGRL
jgi:hypothetical protein